MSVYKGYAYDNLAINNPQLHNPKLTGTMTNLLTANPAPQVITVTNATYTVTANDHDKIISLNRAAGVTVTLPTPTGSYRKYTFVVGVQLTSNSHIIKVPSANESIYGVIGSYDFGDKAPELTWHFVGAAEGFDTITLALATTGGLPWITMIEVFEATSTTFLVRGFTGGVGMSGTATNTPFSATVS